MALDKASITALIVMGFAGLAALQYYYNMELQECTSDPFVYGARQMQTNYGYPFQGTGMFIIPGQQSPILSFNANGSSFRTTEVLTGFDLPYNYSLRP